MNPGRPPRAWFFAALALVAVAVVVVLVVRSRAKEPAPIMPMTSPIDRPHHMAPPPFATRTPSRATTAPSAEPSIDSSPESGGPKGKLVIHGAGDTNVDPNYVTSFKSQGYGYALSGMNGLFQHDDLTVVNMECPVTTKGTIIPKEFNFHCDPKALPTLYKDGIDVANQANNHAYDYGPEGLLDSLKNIKKSGMQSVGAGADDVEANKAAIYHVKGWTIAVVGWDAVVDPYPIAVAGPDHPGTADGHDFHAAVDEVKAAARISDLVILDVHWGVELDTQPEAYQIPQAHKLIDAGADIIFGGHSHRLQPLEMYKGRPIFYSLGNFVWPAFSDAGGTTAVAEVTVTPDGRFKARMLPARIEGNGHPVLTGH